MRFSDQISRIPILGLVVALVLNFFFLFALIEKIFDLFKLIEKGSK